MELKIVSNNGQLVTDSREVAEITGKEHKELMRTIRQYAGVLTSANLRSSDFFIPHYYQDAKKEQRPCFLLTRKGCDMVANKMTGQKGILFTAAYVTKFEEMEKQIQSNHRLPGSYKEALLQLVAEVEEKEKLQLEVSELKPKASYHDHVLNSTTLLSVTQIAKDYGMGAPSFNKLLQELGIQYKKSGVWHLYHKYQDKGYTATKTHIIDTERSKIHTNWTQKGRLFLYETLKKEGIIPLLERGEKHA